MRRTVLVIALALACSAAACDSSVSGGGGAGGGGGNGGAGGAGGSGGGGTGGTGASGGSGGTGGVGGNNCGVQTFTLDRLPPDLLVVLDKSGSMNDQLSGGTKWAQVTSVLDTAVMNTQSEIRWGLTLFSNDGSCGVANTPPVPIAVSNYTAIHDEIAANSPGGHTPTRTAELAAGTYMAGLTDPNPKYILLATDGQPNCIPGDSNIDDTDATGAEAAVSTVAGNGVHTFVVGIAIDSTADGVLEQMAINGMEPRAGGPPSYYPVANPADLQAALATIAGQIVSCTFPLTQVPPNPGNVTVTADGNPVPRDLSHTNGWDFGAGNMSIIFFGSFCQQLQAGSISDVNAIFGCPPIGLGR